MAHDSNAKGPDFLTAFMEHAKNLTSFEMRHHRQDQENGAGVPVASLESLAKGPGLNGRSALRTLRKEQAASVIKVFPRAADKGEQGRLKE